MTTAASLAGVNVDGRLNEGLRLLGLSLSHDNRARLGDYVALLAKWNRTYNLTAIREPGRMVTQHVLDALAVLPHLPQIENACVLDVGSGGGVPGIPLAIARPDWSVVLVDSNQKKVAFLTQAAIELSLRNVRPVAARVEELSSERPFDVVIGRAFADLRSFADVAAKHLAPTGQLYAMKGVFPEAEIAALPATIEVVAAIPLQVPGLDAARHLIVLQPRMAAA
ncbi:MAG TPA: 16S rRNA (guanine(527)-N(7))-methyltransferase RsmG [Casimicrobiaceae bacterium]|jgi:16S rRNA (guanine527-N7)-methyltransferase